MRPEHCITGLGKQRVSSRGRIRAMNLHVTDMVRTASRPLRSMRAHKNTAPVGKGERSAFKPEIKNLMPTFDTNFRLIYL